MVDVSFLIHTFLQVNDDWQRGYSDGCTGSFPAAFVQSFPQLTLPPKGKVFLCVEEFPLLQHGDLAINPGQRVDRVTEYSYGVRNVKRGTKLQYAIVISKLLNTCIISDMNSTFQELMFQEISLSMSKILFCSPSDYCDGDALSSPT